jgi:uncharacterized membrane protein SpoIIM required for sporulation
VDYARFVRMRTPLWDAFEARLAAARRGDRRVGHADVETLAYEYRQVLHDHALAAARFAGTGAARRLRRLALEGTHWLQWDRGDHVPGLLTFFARTFPRAMRRQAGHIGIAAGLFVSACILGASLGLVEPGAGLVMLSPQMVDGLKRGHLWTESLVTTVPPVFSSSRIATNNMAVALTGWAGGALAGVGALYVLLFNGYILGVLLAATLHYAMADRLLEFIAAHGPLELTLIVATAGAGLGLGRALVAADDRPRAEVLRSASRDALVVLLGCLPWFVLLGLVEAFISPAPGVPVALKLALGASLEATFLAAAWNPLLKESDT